MAFHVTWSRTAKEDFKEIVEFISLDDPSAAARLADRILARIERAAEMPFSNRVVPEKDDESVREAIMRPYRIVYLVDERGAAIHVLRVWHAARGVPDLS